MRRSPLFVVYLTVFVDLLGFSIILPLLPFYAKEFGAGGLWVGALLTAYSAAQFVSAPYLGHLSDRIGRRPVLLLSLAGSAVALTITGAAHSLWLLLVARAVDGLFGGSISTGQAYIADVTPPEHRARSMGALGAAIGLGFVIGPGLGAGLSHFGFGTAAYVAAGIAAANFVFGLFRLPESLDRAQRARHPRRAARASLLAGLRRPAVARIVSTMFLATFAFAGMEATFALLGQREFGLDARGFGLIFTYVGVVAILMQGVVVRRLHARTGDRRMAVTGALLMGVGLFTIPLAHDTALAVLFLTLLAAGQGLTSPSLASLLSREGDEQSQGSTLGLGQAFSAAARALGPLTAGALFDLGVALPYLLGGLLLLAGAWIVSRGSRRANLPIPQDSLAG